MSSDSTQSGTPEGGSEIAAIDEAGTGSIAVSEDGISVSVAQAEPDTAPPSMFRPTMRDVDASASETGMTVKPRPMMPDEPADGGTAPCTDPDAAADQSLILGPSDQGETGGTTTPAAEAEGATPTVAPEALADGTNLFGDRAAMWSGNPSEVGAAYGLDPTHGEVCLCDEVSLAVGEDV